jgi:hypothetical protein
MRPRTAAIASAVLALVQARMIYSVLGKAYPENVKASFGVVLGQPHWRIYQSRVLGPYLVDSLRHVFPGPVSAFAFVGLLALFVAGLLACRVGNRVGGECGAWRALAMTHAVFAFLLAYPWLFIWDYLDLVVFFTFLVLVIEERPTGWFAALCLLGMLNHEIAIVIAMWLVVDGLMKRSWVRAAVGAGCAAAGLVTIELLRSALLVEEIGPKIFLDAPKTHGSSFFIAVPSNLHDLRVVMTHWDYGLSCLTVAFVIAVPAVAWWLLKREHAWRSYVIANVLMLGSLVTFGRMLESRIYVVLIPMLALSAAARRPR